MLLALRDARHFAQVVQRYEKPLLRYVRRLLGAQNSAAEDVVQEAFLKAYVNLNAFDHGRPLPPWLYRIAHNEAISLLRKRKAQGNILGHADSSALLERIAAEESQVDLCEARDSAIHGVLAGLDERYREVLVLRFLEDKSYSDIADILRLPQGTVATLIRRGLQRLRTVLEQRGVVLVEFET
jgi:RNA polymerase sigma-70 factor, ECF subfamily